MPQTDFWPFQRGKTGEHVEHNDDAKVLVR